MTRKEAIKQLKGMVVGAEWLSEYMVEALDMAIKALEQKPSDDATLKDIFCMGCEYKEQEPKTGHWIDTNSDNFDFHRVYKCSECGTTEIEYPESIGRFRFCPDCGAKMESEE